MEMPIDHPTVPASPTAKALESDPAAWDSFVAVSSTPTHLQATAWADVKRTNGWRAKRLAIETHTGPVGLQLLMLTPARMPWGLGYVPRGPVTTGALDRAAIRGVTARIRDHARIDRLAWVRMEPEAEAGHGVEEWLTESGWDHVRHVQPESSRLIDISREEKALWSDLRSSTRWSVNKARRSGLKVVVGDGSRIDDFHALYAPAIARAGVPPRPASHYHDMWQKLAPKGMAHLLFVEREETGEALATVFMVSCGPRIVDLSSGTTQAGDKARANHLLKWDAMMLAREWGFREYDFYGTPVEGISEFKASFGGRPVQYVGAWQLSLAPVGRRVLTTAEQVRRTYWQLRNRGRVGPTDADGG
ncbi:MAG: peptidoglycan bridge formation glycyltransferase FemA/FemB family protein [Candidatus Limnocylindrales bacterium]